MGCLRKRSRLFCVRFTIVNMLPLPSRMAVNTMNAPTPSNVTLTVPVDINAVTPDAAKTVSYTHLDVYKRQVLDTIPLMRLTTS